MLSTSPYPKRLIEVDLPIARISAHARREKSIRHGHISTLHIWWARRPLAACRAVICAALWPDPADSLCPDAFRETARRLMSTWAADHGKLQGAESFPRFLQIQQKPGVLDDNNTLRQALLDFIADFANWDNSTVPAYLETSRALTQAAHEALGGAPGTRPLVVDPFAGGGSIPLEALRVGADAFASDLNPVAVLLNKVLLEYIPKHDQHLADEIRQASKWIKREAEKELAEFYPTDADGATPIAYLWARTIQCEGPGCGAEVPLIRSLWLAKKTNRSVALQLVPNPTGKRVNFHIIVTEGGRWVNQDDPKARVDNPNLEGTVKRGSATCPCCGYTTPLTRVREQLRLRRGGSQDARLLSVVTNRKGVQGRAFRVGLEADAQAVQRATSALALLRGTHFHGVSVLPEEPTPKGGGQGAGRGLSHTAYAMDNFTDMYTPRQMLALATLAKQIRRMEEKNSDPVVGILLAFALGRTQDLCGSLSTWANTLEAVCGSNRAQNRMPIVWDFVEAVPIAGAGGDFDGQVDWVARVVEHCTKTGYSPGNVSRAAAQKHALPSDSADAIVTDPPYYDAFAYSDLSDFFYTWLRRAIPSEILDYRENLTPKELEIVVYGKGTPGFRESFDEEYFRSEMTSALAESRRVAKPVAIGVVVFANKSTEGWEALLGSAVNAGWIITASWPIDTERPVRQRAQDSAALASSVHLICRPRENPDGSLRDNQIGDWRDVVSELPGRIHDWMPRLAEEGVVGADAIFACLGPALEIFSRYSRVEKSSGDVVPLREYLEHVWASISHEALTMIFKDADAAGLEPDARLTAMWLWTLGATAPAKNGSGSTEDGTEEDADTVDEEEQKPSKVSGFVLEFDAARKIAQGLGIHLEKTQSIVEVKGDKARLLPVAERTKYLFGKDTEDAPTSKKKPKKKDTQLTLFEALKEADSDESTVQPELKAPQAGSTVLDRVHQAMILFAAGRGDALKRFLVEEGIGKDARFWKLAQSLSALYPPGIDEKRWVDGVLARKKGLGL